MQKTTVLICGLLAGVCLVSVLGAQLGGSPAQRYQYLPARQNLWVIDHEKGAIVFFKFPDSQDRPIQRSKTYFVDRTRFPQGEAHFELSMRSLSSLLWITNKKTGEVQVLRYRRDGTFAAEFRLQAARQFQYN